MEWLVVVLLATVAYVLFRLRRNRVDISVFPEHFVVIDVETTGLDALRHEIIEIGAVQVNRDSTRHQRFQVLVRPAERIPRRITEITGITQEMVEKEGVGLESAMADFIAFVGNHQLVAFNADFDMAFLHNAASRFGQVINNPTSCALKMAKRAWPRRKSYKLADLSKDGGLSTNGAHRALHDCEVTMTVYAAAASKLRSLN